MAATVKYDVFPQPLWYREHKHEMKITVLISDFALRHQCEILNKHKIRFEYPVLEYSAFIQDFRL